MITVQIGNTDDKLSQHEWSNFFHRTDELIRNAAYTVYFSGHALPAAPWQNACWCFDVEGDEEKAYLQRMLRKVAKTFRQDSVAWTEGETELIA